MTYLMSGAASCTPQRLNERASTERDLKKSRRSREELISDALSKAADPRFHA